MKIAGCWKSGQARFKTVDGPRSTVNHCGGQATLEYAIVAGVLVAMVAIMSLFLAIFSGYGERVLDIIASDYP